MAPGTIHPPCVTPCVSRTTSRTPCIVIISLPSRDTLHSRSGVTSLLKTTTRSAKILGSTPPLIDADPGYVELVLTHLTRPQCNQLINLQVRIPTLRAQGPLHTTHGTLNQPPSVPPQRTRFRYQSGSSRAVPLPLVEQGSLIYVRPSPWRVVPDAVSMLIVLASLASRDPPFPSSAGPHSSFASVFSRRPLCP